MSRAGPCRMNGASASVDELQYREVTYFRICGIVFAHRTRREILLVRVVAEFEPAVPAYVVDVLDSVSEADIPYIIVCR